MNALSPARVTRSKQQARKYYNAISRFYDLLSGRAEKRLCDFAIQRLSIQPGERVLEIGIGTGRGLRGIAERIGPSGSAVGIDISDGMLAVAYERIIGAGIENRTTLVCGDGARLPFCAGMFDAIFMSFALELFDTPEIPAVLAQCRRVLKTGGRLGIVSMALPPDPNGMSKLYAAMHAVFPVWVDCRPIGSRQAVESAGFTVFDAVRDSMFSLPVDVIISKK